MGISWFGTMPAVAGGRHHLLGSILGVPKGISSPHVYGYGLGVPTFRWGYFGAYNRPLGVYHTGYYNQYVQWGYRQGY